MKATIAIILIAFLYAFAASQRPMSEVQLTLRMQGYGEGSGIGPAQPLPGETEWGRPYDTNGDGVADLYAKDTDGDGEYDTIYRDTDGDGQPDQASYIGNNGAVAQTITDLNTGEIKDFNHETLSWETNGYETYEDCVAATGGPCVGVGDLNNLGDDLQSYDPNDIDFIPSGGGEVGGGGGEIGGGGTGGGTTTSTTSTTTTVTTCAATAPVIQERRRRIVRRIAIQLCR